MANANTTVFERGGSHTGWKLRQWHLILLLAGILLRMAFSLTVDTQSSYAGWDGEEYHAYAISLLHLRGDDYPRTLNAIRPPGYPIFLMPFVAIDPRATWHVQLVQCILGAILALIIASIAARWQGKRAADIAFIATLFYPAIVFYSAFVLTEVVFSVLLWAGIACLLSAADAQAKAPTRLIVWSGILFGFASLTRPGLQLFLPLAALWIVWTSVRWFKWKVALWRATIFTAVTSSLLLPWLLGNLYAHGEFSLAPGEGQANFFLGSSRGYLQTYEATTKEEYYRSLSAVMALLTRESNFTPQAWMDAANDFRRHHTRDWLKLQWYKTLHFWTPWLNPTIFDRRNYWVSIVFTTPLFGLAAGELWRRRKSPDPLLILLLGLMAIGYLVGGLIFHSQVRYRIPYVEVTFLLLASSWVSCFSDYVPNRLRTFYRSCRW